MRTRIHPDFAAALWFSMPFALMTVSVPAQDSNGQSPETNVANANAPLVAPQEVTQEHFSAIRAQSPFLRTLNLAETYSLRAVAQIDGQPVATLYNRETKKTLTISKDEANAAGIQMVEVIPGKDLDGVTVKVSFAGEVVDLKYDADQLSSMAQAGGKGGGERKDGDGQRKGPSPEEKKRYESLSKEQKEKFHQYARQTMQKYPNISREERYNMIRGALSRLSEGKDIQVDAPQQGGDR
jgi:hypothetical protein